MNARQRLAAAMRCDPDHPTPDRVPVMCQLALGHYFLHGGRPAEDIWFDSDAFAHTLSLFRRRYGFDGVLVNLPGRPANWRDWLASTETDGEHTVLTWLDGCVTRFPPDDNAYTFAPGGGDLPRADSTSVDVDDPATYRLAGYVWNTWHAPGLWDIPPDADLTEASAYPDWFPAAVAAARELEPEASVHAEVFSPFTHLLELFGYDRALMALLDAPDTCHRLLDRFTAVAAAQVQCLAGAGPDAVLVSSAFAGAGFISREMYREFVVPYERRLADAIAAAGLPSYVHTCGAIGDRLDLMAETNVGGIDTLDPPPLGTVDLARAKANWGERLFFKGNLDAVHEMLRADDAAFDRAVRQRLADGMPGGGYILSSACSVAPHVAPDRLVRMVELAREYGTYPEASS